MLFKPPSLCLFVKAIELRIYLIIHAIFWEGKKLIKNAGCFPNDKKKV